MSNLKRTEAEIHNLRKILDYQKSLGWFLDKKYKKAVQRMLRLEGFPNLKYFWSLNQPLT